MADAGNQHPDVGKRLIWRLPGSRRFEVGMWLASGGILFFSKAELDTLPDSTPIYHCAWKKGLPVIKSVTTLEKIRAKLWDFI